jgi:hypothetical protein
MATKSGERATMLTMATPRLIALAGLPDFFGA